MANLARFISVMKFRPLIWRNSHPSVLADRASNPNAYPDPNPNRDPYPSPSPSSSPNPSPSPSPTPNQVLADRMEDVTPPAIIERNPQALPR